MGGVRAKQGEQWAAGARDESSGADMLAGGLSFPRLEVWRGEDSWGITSSPLHVSDCEASGLPFLWQPVRALL